MPVYGFVLCEYFNTLLYSGADCKACDNSDMTPFMIAAEKGHMDVAKTILRRDSTVVSTTTMKWALEKNLTAFFQVSKLWLLSVLFSMSLVFVCTGVHKESVQL